MSPDDETGIADVFAFIEVKANAATNWPLRTAANGLPLLSGSVAAEINAHYLADSPRNGQRMCQSDLYRSRQWWTEPDGIRLADPDDVLWLLFDTRGRQSSVAFHGASKPDEWLSIDLKLFAAHLRESRHLMPLTEAQNDTIAVVLWHIDQAAGKNWELTTQIIPPPTLRPAIDEIGQDSSA